MGHRALLAYSREGSTYDLHRSHWGGADFALARHVSAETPFASGTGFAVDPDPVATGLELETAVAESLDFLAHEAFFRVGPDYETAPFHVCWFGLETDSDRIDRSETVGHGALVEARPAEGDDYFRGWFRATKAAVGDAVDRGDLTREEALDYLASRVESWAEDREVIRPE
ncbi:hypothetical protein NGM10_06010 [Halorussus salilacus]|uniref:DUF6735 family protein n=1 Tax=Halorussus salilacus TaxID=2953750 RepID=UPI00209ECF36|nr:DUF6735 family protein [Halorussus salilacus]USZ69288.1 hypothetical protein NGM10_06010 [Halorussus salilacus]